MARIPDDELERLKREVALERLVEAKGVKLEKRGADLVGRCPFHDDAGPSLVVTPGKNIFHCFGCGVGGSVVDWVMKAEGVSFRHAALLLKEQHPLSEAVVTSSTVRKLPAPVAIEGDDQQLLDDVAGYYHTTLLESPEALAYLASRGLSSRELLTTFKIGFANRTLGLRLPMKNRVAGGEIRARLQALGVLRESGHEHLRGSITIPILDDNGHVLGVYGRKITEGLRPGTPNHLYLPGPHRAVFNASALSLSDEAILCESLIDALTFWEAGYRAVTTSYGVEGFLDEHVAAFHEHKVRRVLIAYDRDDAGDRAAEKLAARLIAEGFECRRVQFPKGMDANEYALKVGPASKSLGVALRHAVWIGTGRAPEVELTTTMELLENSIPLVAGAASGSAPAPTSSPTPAAAAPSLPLRSPLRAASAPTATALSGSPRLTVDVVAEVKGDEATMSLGDRRYRVRGFTKNTAHDIMKVNLLVSRDTAFHVDTLDLYMAKARAAFIKAAAAELSIDDEVLKKDLGRVLLKLEELQDEELRKALETKSAVPVMSEEEQQVALELLRDPRLLDRILADFMRCGVVGEETNKLVGYLAMTSRKLDQPLAVIIQSSSAAGKSSLMEAVLALCPDEEKTKYSAMTGQSLFYMGESDLKHKVLAVVEEEGCERASYALKLLQSEGELTIASTGKDPDTGKLVTHEYRVEGPVMIFLTTTAIEIDEELLNRCLVLTVDEQRAQTQAIHKLQRERRTLLGLLAKNEKAVIHALHMNAQRLLRPLSVVNPYAERLTFLDDRTRTRRDHMKYLGLIDAIALLHQHQRTIHSVERDGQVLEYIEVTLDDIAVANRLAHVVLGRSLDELPPQTRTLLMKIEALCARLERERSVERCDLRLTRREILDETGWSLTPLRKHLERLVELEHLIVHLGRRGQTFTYELVYDGSGKDGGPFLAGLLDVEKLGLASTISTWLTPGSTWPALDGQLAPQVLRQNSLKARECLPLADAVSPHWDAPAASSPAIFTEKALKGSRLNGASYEHGTSYMHDEAL